MNWKNRLTNYNFWISIVSAILLILQAFKFEFDIAYISEIVTAVLGLLVVIGIISDPTKTTVKTDKEKQIPSDKENEIDTVINQDDIKILVTQIANDLKENFKIDEKNTKNEAKIIEKTENFENFSKIEQENKLSTNQEKIVKTDELAVAETHANDNVEQKSFDIIETLDKNLLKITELENVQDENIPEQTVEQEENNLVQTDDLISSNEQQIVY